jgi:glycine cleavage system aminomethyltransferase T
VSFEFLAIDAATPFGGSVPVARSPMERGARAAGARFEVRDGWNVAVGFAGAEPERRALEEAAGWADLSHLGKLEVQAGQQDLEAVATTVVGEAPELGRAVRTANAWWLPYTRERAVVLCDPGTIAETRGRVEEAAAAASGFTSVVEVTTGLVALAIAGPIAREVIARFSAVDLRPAVTRPHDFKPVSVARTPGAVLVQDTNHYVLMVGAAFGAYLWEVVEDAGRRLGASPVGVDALPAPLATPQEAGAHA